MKTFLRFLVLGALFLSTAAAQEIDPEVQAEERTVPGDLAQRYFLIRHRQDPAKAPRAYGLLLVLPGGDGSRAFLPFCANAITRLGTPEDVLVAELVAPVWDPVAATRVVWPGEAFPDARARFTTEEFMAAVIGDIGRQYPLRDHDVCALGWSSGGPAVYAASFTNPAIRGAFLAMSTFQPDWLPAPLSLADKRYYLWHSPDDAVCPYVLARQARDALTKQGAAVVLKNYPGGHGWQPNTFYLDRIKEALVWFRASPEEAAKIQAGFPSEPASAPPKS